MQFSSLELTNNMAEYVDGWLPNCSENRTRNRTHSIGFHYGTELYLVSKPNNNNGFIKQ